MVEYCEPCNRDFGTWASYKQHMSNSSNHNYCDGCDRDFDSWNALEQHWIQSPRHHYCRRCGDHFADDEDLMEHCEDQHHYCEPCNRFFDSSYGLEQHDRQCHYPDYYCAECNRVFSSENNLREHMNSSVHRPRNVPCAFQHRGCDKHFISKSAMISHLESGACSSGANRNMIRRWIRMNDRDNVVTVPRLITDGYDDPPWIATERSWSGAAYECVLCHNTFRTLDALNCHLASPRHQDRMYRCPLSSCCETFNTLGGLCRHVESESCGILRFRAVREVMDDLLRDMRRLRIQRGKRQLVYPSEFD